MHFVLLKTAPLRRTPCALVSPIPSATATRFRSIKLEALLRQWPLGRKANDVRQSAGPGTVGRSPQWPTRDPPKATGARVRGAATKGRP